MKTFKKSLSLFLCVCLFASIAVVAALPASANYGDDPHRPLLTETVKDVETNTYYFYMPESWKNEYNDVYDGKSLDSCKAGVYWWEGSFQCEDAANQNGTGQGWPGYVITETDPADSNIYVAKVPTDVFTIVFNNTVNGTNDPDNPAYTKAIQTSNIVTDYYFPEDDKYGFYPDGSLEVVGPSFNNMIYVCNPKDTDINEFSGKETYNGIWLFYYGNGEYGVNKERVEGEVYKNGEFPPYGLQVAESVEVEVGSEEVILCNDNAATAEVEDASIATVTKDASGVVKVKGVKAGTTTVTFTLVKEVVDKETGETTTKVETAVCKVTVTAKPAPKPPTVTKKANTMNVKANTLSAKLKNAKKKAQTFTAKKAFKFAKKAQGAVTYKKVSGDSKLSIAKNTGKITLKKVTKAKTYKIKVKVTAAGNKNYKSKSQTVTVKIKVKK